MRKYPSNPKYIRVEVRTDPIIREVIRIEVVDQIVETEDSMETIDLDITIETIIFKGTLECMEDKIIEENTEIICTMNIRGGRHRSRERTFLRNYGNNRDRSFSNSRSRSGSRASTNRDRIRCYNCREYDHFVRDCPNSKEEQPHLLASRQDSPTQNYRSPLNL